MYQWHVVCVYVCTYIHTHIQRMCMYVCVVARVVLGVEPEGGGGACTQTKVVVGGW